LGEGAVKWQEDRSEGFVSDNQGRDHSTRAELALDENGRFLGLRVSILANLGAYLSPFGCFVPTRSTDLVSGLYSIEATSVLKRKLRSQKSRTFPSAVDTL
jgi:carbon-monoxide dehydrogenase large subunit